MFLSILSRGALRLGGAGTLAVTMRPLFLNAVVNRIMAIKVEFPVIKMETPVVP